MVPPNDWPKNHLSQCIEKVIEIIGNLSYGGCGEETTITMVVSGG